MVISSDSASAVEAQHDAGRKRPGLAAVVVHLAHPHAGFLHHLAADRFLQALARLHEAGERRIHRGVGKPVGVAEQRAVAAVHQHDDGGVGAGEMAGCRRRCSA